MLVKVRVVRLNSLLQLFDLDGLVIGYDVKFRSVEFDPPLRIRDA